MNQPNNIYLEEKCDEEDDEIQQIILNNQKNFERGNLKKISQSISAHANLDFQFKHKKLLESDGREEEENKITNNKLNCEDGCHVDEEDSDEEFFAAHSSLIPLRKSKSALAGFTSHLGTSASHSKPLLCSKIVKEGINDSQEEIMEMIDLRKGDILQFRIEDDLKNDRKRSDNLAGCSPSQYSPIQTLPTSPEPQSQHQLEQDCWSAPACPNDSPDSFEIGEGDEEYSKDLKMLSSEKQDLNYRKESSWSAPGQFNSEMIEIPLQNEKKEDKLEAEKLRKKNIFTGNENNDLIPMADDDGSNTPNYASLHGGYLTLPPGFKCHSAVDNSKLSDTMNSSFSSYFSDDEEEQSPDSFHSQRRKRQQLMHHSAAMRLCRRGSPPFAQIDLLSESEISDLEQQIASGCLVNRDHVLTTNYEGDERTNKHSSIDDEYFDQDLEDFKQQKPSDGYNHEMHSFETEKYCHHHLPQMRFHYSMPAIVNSLQDSVPDRVKFRRSDTEDFLIERKAGASSELSNHQSPLKQDDFCNTQTNQNVTPSTLSDCETEDKLPTFNPPIPNNRQHLSLSFTSKRRQLPKTPSPEDPLEHIDIATASRERLLDVLKQTYQLLNLSREKESGRNKHLYMNCEDQLDHNREKDETKLALQSLPSPSVLREIQSKLPKNCCRAQALEDEQQYTFSYGMDHSTNARSIGRRRLFSIEGSYYEDNLPGVAAPLDSDYEFRTAREDHQPLNELYSPTENDRSKGYIFADGAKSSSGISSSCYTSSSRSCELPDCDQQQKTTPRERRRSPRLDDSSIVPTHRAQFEFMPRHADELRLDRGDAVHVNEKFNDHWCFGLNLRSGQRGIFPEALIVEIDLVDEICKKVLPETKMRLERDTFYLTMLASVEVAHHKGNDILVQAINKVCSMYLQKDEILVPQTVLMEISFRGIHVIDKRKKDIFRCPTFDYFYSLQNISFCGAHPKELRYFGFITKHPILPRFACHVFLSNESTQAIVEAIGRAFKRSYDEYMAFAHPTEDIFLDE